MRIISRKKENSFVRIVPTNNNYYNFVFSTWENIETVCNKFKSFLGDSVFLQHEYGEDSLNQYQVNLEKFFAEYLVQLNKKNCCVGIFDDAKKGLIKHFCFNSPYTSNEDIKYPNNLNDFGFCLDFYNHDLLNNAFELTNYHVESKDINWIKSYLKDYNAD